MLYVIVSIGPKIHGTKFLPTGPRDKISEKFLLEKISGYMVHIIIHVCDHQIIQNRSLIKF